MLGKLFSEYSIALTVIGVSASFWRLINVLAILLSTSWEIGFNCWSVSVMVIASCAGVVQKGSWGY